MRLSKVCSGSRVLKQLVEFEALKCRYAWRSRVSSAFDINSPRLFTIYANINPIAIHGLSIECACEYQIPKSDCIIPPFPTGKVVPSTHLLTKQPPPTPALSLARHIPPLWNLPNLTPLLPRATKSPTHLSSGCVQRTRPYHTWYTPDNTLPHTPYSIVYFSPRISSLLKTTPVDPLLHSLFPLSSTTKTLRSRPSDPLQYGCCKDAAHGAGLESRRSCRRRQIREVSKDDDVQSEAETRK